MPEQVFCTLRLSGPIVDGEYNTTASVVSAILKLVAEGGFVTRDWAWKTREADWRRLPIDAVTPMAHAGGNWIGGYPDAS